MHGGPLTSMELSQLSLLCTGGSGGGSGGDASLTLSSPLTNGGVVDKKAMGDWATLDGDLLSSLTPMLQAHVVSAVSVDLVGEGREVVSKYTEASSNPDKHSGPVITIHQVRCIYYYFDCIFL